MEKDKNLKTFFPKFNFFISMTRFEFSGKKYLELIPIFHIRAVDPHSFFADPDPAFLLNADPDPAASKMWIRIQPKQILIIELF